MSKKYVVDIQVLGDLVLHIQGVVSTSDQTLISQNLNM